MTKRDRCDGCGRAADAVYRFDYRARWGDVIDVWLGVCCSEAEHARVLTDEEARG